MIFHAKIIKKAKTATLASSQRIAQFAENMSSEQNSSQDSASASRKSSSKVPTYATCSFAPSPVASTSLKFTNSSVDAFSSLGLANLTS